MSSASLLAKAVRRSRRAVGRLRRAAAGRRTRPVPGAVAVQPEVADERTNVGPMMDALVMRAKRNGGPQGVDADYDLLRENFDHLHFMLQAKEPHALADADPIRMFLRRGASAPSSPDYNFAMKDYLARHPERKDGRERSPYLEWIKHGRAAGEIADPAQGIEPMARLLGLEPREIVDELVATRADMMERLRTGRLGRMFAGAAEIEPLIGAVWPETTRTRMIPLGGKFVVGQVAAVHACQESAGFRRARLVVVADGPRWNGGRPFEGHLAHALAATITPDEIVVIYTDRGGAAPEGSLPADTREIDFAAAADGLTDEHRIQALVALLRSFQADVIINADSRILYRALTPYGKALAASERIFLFFSSNEQKPEGNRDGWSLKWFYAGIDLAAGFITDSEYLRDQLTGMYQLGEADRERIHVLRAPVRPSVAAAAPGGPQLPLRRAVVHWAGDGAWHNRINIAIEIARRMPDVDFVFWLAAGSAADRPDAVPDNVRLHGALGDVSQLDLSGADAWLYTSAWDGVPSLLLDVAMTELPIVGGLVGGVGEVLTEQDSWPVADVDNPEAYEKALREIISDPAQARGRSGKLRERLERERTRRAYAEHAARVLFGRAEPAEVTG